MTGTIGAVLDGTPLTVTGCGAPVRLSPARTEVRVIATDQYTATRLTLRPPDAGRRRRPSTGGGDRRDVGVRSWTTSRRVLDVASGPAALLVLPENVNAGWRATLDGHELTPLRVDGWMQGYLLPAGDGGRVTLEFTPNRLYQAGLGLGGLLALAAGGGGGARGASRGALVSSDGSATRSARARPVAPVGVALASARPGGGCGCWADRPSRPDCWSATWAAAGSVIRARSAPCSSGRCGAGRRARGEPAGEPLRPAADLVRRAGGRRGGAGGRRAPDAGRATVRSRADMADRTRVDGCGRGPAPVAVGRRRGGPGADRRTARLAGGAPGPRLLHPGRLPDADPRWAPPVGRPADA